MRNTADVTGGKPLAIWLQSISGGDSVNPLVVYFYDNHGRKREVFFLFCPGHHTRFTELFIVVYEYNKSKIFLYVNLILLNTKLKKK
jgi:hypothetical protein